MKGFVINCKNSTERLRQFYENDFPFPIEGFEAIEGDTPRQRDFMSGLSHLAVMGSQIEFPFAVFEDDCVLLQPWSVVEEAMSQLPLEWDALWLGATLQAPLERYSKNLYRLRDAYAIHAVIYNSKKIINFASENFIPEKVKTLDFLMAHTVQKAFNCFVTYPMVATQRACISDINGMFLDNYNIIIDSYNKYIK